MPTQLQISPREMLVNACHVGHKQSSWDPKIKNYLYGTKNGVHIFDLAKSADMLVKMLNKIGEFTSEGKIILFVSTKPQTTELLLNIHETTGMPIVSHKWFGGLLTNFQTIKQRIALMRSLKDQFQTGEIEKYTKKEQVKFRKELLKLERALGGLEGTNRLADAVFVVDGKRDEIALTEANKLGVPVFGIMDSNTNPDLYDFGVGANDDGLKSLEYILGHTEEAILNNKKEKKTISPLEKKENASVDVVKMKK